MVMVLWLEQTSRESSWFEFSVVSGPESKKAFFFVNLDKNFFFFIFWQSIMESVCWLVVTPTHWGGIWTQSSITAFPKPMCVQPLDHHGFHNECGILGWLVACNDINGSNNGIWTQDSKIKNRTIYLLSHWIWDADWVFWISFG